MSRERVLVAMSGGVDSSVAAARLLAAGHEVIGATLHLWDYPDDGSARGRCCAPEDVYGARRVADALGIPHYTFDRRELFEAEVVTPFVEAYLQGVTPSPCVRCNRGVKIPELLGLADRLGARWLATGHYARIVEREGVLTLLQGHDTRKDQSYFLHMLPQATLARLRFPLGEATKAEVRREAAALGLPGADKGESQELCFVADGRYAQFVAERARERLRPGKLLDEDGRPIATHAGVHAFTLGQRRNLGVAVGKRSYVVRLDPALGTVQLGDRERLAVQAASLEELTLRAGVELPLRCEVAVRYHGARHPALVEAATPGAAEVRFDHPVIAVVPGQYAVFYAGEQVLGGGVIRASQGAEELPA